MALRDLGGWLLNIPGFRRQVDQVVIDAACGELGTNFIRIKEHQNLEHDWSYLMLAASVLAQSDMGQCQATALRIAQTCLSDINATGAQRDSAALVLDALANHPAIKLAEQREFLKPSFVARLPGVARLDYTRRAYEHSVTVHGDTPLRVNRFQRKLWEEVRSKGWMSVSAPTSAGKSFILARWICELMRASQIATVVYLVPTRALISQVERDLRELFSKEDLDEVSISALPILKTEDGPEPVRKRVFVFTQERLHILLSAKNDLSAVALIVDEAHKVGDRQRGVLLQDVIERLSTENPELRVVFASPMTSNPELLLADARRGIATAWFSSDDVTVTQNLFWATQRPQKPKVWDVLLCAPNKGIPLGEVTLKSKPGNDSKRLSFVAHAISGTSHGNIVYVNGAAEAEKIAAQLFDLIGADVEGESAKELQALIELAQHVVHKKFALATCLRRGVAFHYGNMPLLIREEIERLFSAGTIRFLVCTSTLIEGVNMACRNIFMRGPRKGRKSLLSAEDFWNLAGRAGRWGKEFQGNIFCIDPDRKDLWGENGPPRDRTRQPIRRTTDDVLAVPSDLLDFIKERTPLDKAKEHPELEYVFSYLAGIHVRHGGLLKAPWAGRYQASSLGQLAEVVETAVNSLDIEPGIIPRNPGISPFALDDLLKGFRSREGAVEELLPTDPTSNDAARVYTRIFGRLCRRACPELGPEGSRAYMHALLVTQWMRGHPLARLIEQRIDYFKKRNKPYDDATEIRDVMKEVEQIARFEAPRGLSCYCDVLHQHLREIKREDLVELLPQFNLFLELGVSQQTQISLIGIGLSRTSTIAVSEYMSSDSMTELQVIRWLRENEELWRNFALPALVKKEIARVLEQHKARTGAIEALS
ncbi:DEAD/DEAH box helicase [Corallococcus sp. AB032C]|uniref:DEAD/DEAH box helicase n=1 Tax=Corallococcus TaxID=83461 RepID=UPI000EC3E025|nr:MULTISPECIES: DEAD/DEAH box helicase [Corallococcus]NPC50366.1 DEAD/DEAH box helicase [Corallococcus exiguus]RKH76019.1 DEAD/DEAH box helicase [Corallococcus sp. AB032C]